MISLTHFLLLILILVVVFGRHKIPELGRGMGEGYRQFKKGLNGEADIDITHTVKQVGDEPEKDREG